jgi:predicted 3-demethylubiquinone-9 3-methyltransferase (glyoxalase superfamily)
VSRYGDAGPGPKGAVMTAQFELDGQEFMALNGGPQCSFTPAVSFLINCETQEDIDYYWTKLTAGWFPRPAGGSETSSASCGKSFPRSWAS